MYRNLLFVAFLFVALVILAACSRGDVTCYCKSGVSVYDQKLGKRVEWQEAVVRCKEIQDKGMWDTCIVMEPK